MPALIVLAAVYCACDKRDGKNAKSEIVIPARADTAAVSAAVGVPAVSADTNAPKTFHADPLEKIPATVPPVEKSDWLQKHWAWYVPAQGQGPAAWSAQEKDIRPEACGTCHPQQYKDWKASLHHGAMGPSVLGQLLDMELDAPILSITCQRCHAPLAEQIPYLQKGIRNPDYVEGFREKGLTCAACHVRNHVHFGPPPRKPAPANGPHGGFSVKAEYESPAFCASCHDFKPGGGMHGKLIQETAEEWRRTPFAAEGKTCQSCHMPDRRHLWKGIHDPEMVRSAVSIQAECDASAAKDSVRASLSLTNVGAGHRLPTYVEPRIVLVLEQLDARGKALPGTREEGVIARQVTEDMDKELSDTRLLPGETFSLVYAHARHPKAASLKAKVEVWPDEGYRLYFHKMLETDSLRPQMPTVVKKIEAARKLDTDSRYMLWEKALPL